MGVMGMIVPVAALVMMVLILDVSSSDALFDGYDGRPRPAGMADKPTTTLGYTPAVNYSGKPADCIWYAWENVHVPPLDSGNCSTQLWMLLQNEQAISVLMGQGGALQGYLYYYNDQADPSITEHWCAIGCFNLRTAPPPVKPPLSAAPPPPARGPSPLALNPPSSSPSSSSAPGPMGSLAPSRKLQVGLIAGICSAGLGGILMGLLLFLCCFKHRKKAALQSTSGLSPDTTNSRPYTFKELSSITKNFNHSELVSSSGGFGDVYKGTPVSGGKLVAVKRIRHDKEHGEASFLAEANSLRQIRHRNLLQLRGWCEAKEGLFLVYDFMSNGSLDKWLHPDSNPNPLAWNVRRSVLAGVASGLEYLHEGWVQCVLHRDIKSSNVMLDADFNPYLGDFGLARLVDHQKLEKTTMPAGTLGYMAPEMHYTGKATKETDVYAFGMLVLEVVCGRRPFMHLENGEEPGDFLLLDRVWRAHEAGSIAKMVDPRVLGNTRGNAVSQEVVMMADLLKVGLLCCLPNPGERPSIRLVGHWFQSMEVGAMDLISLPASQPVPPPRYISVLPSSSGGTSSSNSSSDTTRSSVQTNSK